LRHNTAVTDQRPLPIFLDDFGFGDPWSMPGRPDRPGRRGRRIERGEQGRPNTTMNAYRTKLGNWVWETVDIIGNYEIIAD